MRVLVLNAGSSSLKVRLLGHDNELVADHSLERWPDPDVDQLAAHLRAINGVDAMGHRVVHGGADLTQPVLLNDEVEQRIASLAALAPLQQERALVAIRAARAAFPFIPAVGCFDTAYHTTLSPAASTYALPAVWRGRWDIHRYGFHGLSHSYAARRAAELSGRDTRDLQVVSCHLGAGASLCASRGGRSVDTTMGFTPLEGLVMATRSGSVDPGLLLWLLTAGGLSPEDVSRELEESSGLAGLGGGSGDMRDILARSESGDEQAQLAFDVYLHRLVREIAAMVASLRGLDVLVFTGGVGEHAHPVRAAAAERLGFLGVTVDPERNAAAISGDASIGALDARVATLVIEAREDIEIARHTRSLLAGSHTGATP